MNNQILRNMQTALFVALLVVVQAATMPMGSTIVTGSAVNLLLILSVMLCGLPSGLTVAVMSPIIARFFGIGPLWGIIPFIILGNIALVLAWHLIGNLSKIRRLFAYSAALAAAALIKFAVLYVGIVKIAIPLFLNLPEQQAMVISGMFSVPQLITAGIGGLAAAAVLPALNHILKVSRHDCT